jgi:hypothetical protein
MWDSRLTMAHGTAVAAFDDSSLICTLESQFAKHCIKTSNMYEDYESIQMVHNGARKLKMKAQPSGQPFTVHVILRSVDFIGETMI